MSGVLFWLGLLVVAVGAYELRQWDYRDREKRRVREAQRKIHEWRKLHDPNYIDPELIYPWWKP